MLCLCITLGFGLFNFFCLQCFFNVAVSCYRFASLEIMHTFGTLLEQYGLNKENLNVAILTMMYHVAGDCDRADVLLQLPILKTFSEIWGDSTCTKYVSIF